MTALSSSGVSPGFSSTSIPRWRKIAAARGSILSAMRTLTGSATALLPRPVEPRAERLDVGRFDGRPAPDPQAGRRIPIGADVVRGVFALEQVAHSLLPRAVAFLVRPVGELQADRGIRADRGVGGEILDPVGAL